MILPTVGAIAREHASVFLNFLVGLNNHGIMGQMNTRLMRHFRSGYIWTRFCLLSTPIDLSC